MGSHLDLLVDHLQDLLECVDDGLLGTESCWTFLIDNTLSPPHPPPPSSKDQTEMDPADMEDVEEVEEEETGENENSKGTIDQQIAPAKPLAFW